MPMIRTLRPARKHLALLAGLVAMLVVQPLIGHRTLLAGLFCDVVLFAIYLLTGGPKIVAEVLYHSFMVLFLGFAVAVILGDILRKSVIGADDVVGALCGYILVALVWASLYTLTFVLAPETFSVSKDIVWRLGE